ncbi:uncharacterized protein EV422DRAFT_361283 [Fimicolochytrium jonesii]|uniref:uncharacterized protein n=1 Tax=Fimicolochytrium jonesii TaxID=1396493 RepID=UPI0022FE3922|nr:uncharacterized protein EV422DRAFT_361283 [Fimicolochytrium jonesii]KAI8823591.1 hypothetical protein EV422DRAFT_361283 [Fimicolochytrium jonesii]
MGGHDDGHRLCPFCGIPFLQVDQPRPVQVAKTLLTADGNWFAFAVALYRNYLTPEGLVVEPVNPAFLMVRNEYRFDPFHFQSTGGWVPQRWSEDADLAPTWAEANDNQSDEDEPLPNRIRPDSGEDDEGYVELLDFDSYLCSDSGDGNRGVAVHPGCLRLATAWAGIDEDAWPQEFFTHPTGGPILACACHSQDFRRFPTFDYTDSAEDHSGCVLYDTDTLYFNERVKIYGVDMELPFETSRWDDWYNTEDEIVGNPGAEMPRLVLSEVDEWVMVRPDRFPELPHLAPHTHASITPTAPSQSSTYADKKRTATLVRKVMEDRKVIPDWRTYYIRCATSRSMRNRSRIHRIVMHARRIFRDEEWRTKETFCNLEGHWLSLVSRQGDRSG